jgi:hypothetical protein
MASSLSFRLLDLLQCRRRLPPDAVVCVLQALPALMESPVHLLDQGADLLTRISVRFADLGPFGSLREIMDSDPRLWPAFELELNDVTVEIGSATDRTRSPSRARNSPSRVASMARLLLELLGSARRDTTGGALFSPIAALTPEASDLLGAALEGQAGTDCVVFWQKWLQAAGFTGRSTTGRAAPPADVPASLKATGTVLDLQPADQRHPLLRLTARPEFRIGRSEKLADFSLHAGVPRSDEISRVHAIAERSPAGLTLRDGDGTKPSGNGSSFDGRRLDAMRPSALGRRGELVLGGFYRLELVPVFRNGAISALHLEPPPGDPVLRNAAWIISAIPFHWQGDQLAWGDSDCANLGAFTYADERFFLRRPAGVGNLMLNGVSLPAGEAVSLVDGAVLAIDGRHFRLALR